MVRTDDRVWNYGITTFTTDRNWKGLIFTFQKNCQKTILRHMWSLSPPTWWNGEWKQGRRVWSQEGRWEGEELDTECVVTTSSRSLDDRHSCSQVHTKSWPDISVIIFSREKEGASSGKKSSLIDSGVEHGCCGPDYLSLKIHTIKKSTLLLRHYED